ncbi:MAG TPA: diguanylate cyclase [Candidatus Aquabacterium excrementipullorum]|nr:diguanylate cyclase [Candidatus Aquabacterium excrementipullorum]
MASSHDLPLPGDEPAATGLVWLLGTHPLTRQALARLAWLVPAYAFSCAVLGMASWMGLMPAWKIILLATGSFSGLAVFYVLMRSGWSLRRQEPTLAFARVLFSIGCVALAYALLEPARGLALQYLCIILVFDMNRLTTRQVRMAAIAAPLLIVATLLLTWRLGLATVDVDTEVVNLGMAAVMVPVLLIVSGTARRVRRQMLETRAELAQALERTQALAIRDGLTSLYNRRHLQQRLGEELLRQRRNHRPFCVGLLDIDHFKQINDRHGHATGDTVLREVARLLPPLLPPTAVLARWGGEEFLLLLPDTTLAPAHGVLQRLHQAMAQSDWHALANGLQAVTFSAGLCQSVPTDEIHRTLERVDQALYEAKATGRDRTVAKEPA